MSDQFFGRETELEELKSIWKQVRAEKRPQVVNYIADTGFGKTRLIQAFYQWLSTDPGQGDGKGDEGYWPVDLGTGRQRVVNPPIERFKAFDLKNRRIPWLWWGMYWTDAHDDVRTALVHTSSFLDAHLKMLELNRSGDKAALNAVKDVAVDLIKTGAEAVPVLGTLVKTTELLYKLGKPLLDNQEKRNRAEKGAAYDQDKHLETLASELLERLETTFESTKREVPMVLFLDDIHFATDVSKDEKTLHFLYRMLIKASLSKWPLLVITTHWKAPWQAHLNVTLHSSLPWRGIEEVIKKDEELSGLITFHDMMLIKLPSNTMREIAIDHLPGLSEKDLTAIFDKVDNVRWLIEVLKALKDIRENFENNDCKNSLSLSGLNRLDTYLAQQNYIGVIRQRLQGDSMHDVRQVLGATAWHANGLDFVGPLADAFESRLIEKGLINSSSDGARVMSILRQAINPASLIEGELSNEKLSSLIRFPERGYLEVARELFDVNHVKELSLTLGQRVIEWMEPDRSGKTLWREFEDHETQKVFLGIAVDVLGRLQPHLSQEQEKQLSVVEAELRKQLTKGRLTKDQYEQDLKEAKASLLAQSSCIGLDNAGKYQAISIAELSSILYKEEDSRAWKLAYQLSAHECVHAAREKIDKRAKLAVFSTWEENKDCWPTLRVWIDADLEIEGLNNDSADPDYHAALLRRKSDLDHKEGDTESARRGYQQCLDLAERKIWELGKTAAHLREKAIALERLAALDSTDIARLRYRHCLSTWESLRSEYGETPERLTGLCSALVGLADLDKDSKYIDAARNGYQKALEYAEHIICIYGSSPEYLRDKTIPLERMVNLELDGGNLTAAKELIEQIRIIDVQLLRELGETPMRLRDSMVFLEWTATIDQRSSDIEAARNKYRESLGLHDKLISAYGETWERLHDKAGTLKQLANLENQSGYARCARALYQECLELWERLRTEYGDTPERLHGKLDMQFKIKDIDSRASVDGSK